MVASKKWLIAGIAAALGAAPAPVFAQEDTNFMSAIRLVAKGNAEIEAGGFSGGVENCRQVRTFLNTSPATSQVNTDLAVGAADICMSIALFKSGTTEDGGSPCDYLKSSANLLLPASENGDLPQNFKDFVVGLLKAASDQDMKAGCGIFP